MARPKKPKGSPSWLAKGKLVISAKDKADLCYDILGLDDAKGKDRRKANQVILSLETYLGSYNMMVEAVNSEPSDAAYRDQLIDLRKKANKLYEDIHGSGDWIYLLLLKSGYDFHELLIPLAKFAGETSKAINAKKENKESRGRPKNKAMIMLTNSLYRLFVNYNNDSNSTYAAKEFIEKCFKIARIKLPKDYMNMIYDDSIPKDEHIYITQIR